MNCYAGFLHDVFLYRYAIYIYKHSSNARNSETTGFRQELGHSDSNPRHEDLSKLLRETLRGSYVIMPCHGRVEGEFQTQKGPLGLVERFVGVQEVVGWQFVHNPVVSCIGDLAADAAA